MNTKTRDLNQRPRQTEQNTFRRTALTIALAGITAFSAGSAYAAEDQALADLQKALEVLQAENANLKKQLDNKQIKAADNAAASDTTATSSTEHNAETKTAATEDSSILDAVVVKFKKKSILEKVKDVPKSVSIVSGEELEQLGALNVGEILKRIGNVQWNYGNPKTGSLSIRGISAGSSEAIDPSLGVNVNGVPYAYVALASGSDYVDIDTVDVTRGPQGSTGGKNTSMGTINIRNKRPTFTPEANASITFGQQNALITQAAVGGAVVDDLLAWRGTFYRNQQEGYYKNQYKDIEDRTSYVNTDRTYGRAQFLLTPTEKFNALFSIDFKPKGIEFVNGLSVKNPEPATYVNGLPVYIANGTIVAGKSTASNLTQNKLNRSWFAPAGYTYSNYINQNINEDNNKGILNGSKGASAELNWDVLGHTLTSITAYKDNFFQASNDEGTPFDITKNNGLFVHYKQESQELKLTSKPGGFVDYTAGLFYLQNKSDASSRTRYGSDAGAWFANDTQYSGATTPANGLGFNGAGRALLKDSLDRVFARTVTYTDNQSSALFGQADWHLSTPLTLTTGIRFSKENRSTSQVKEVTDSGFGAALNPVANGGFGSTGTGALAGTNTAAQNSIADQLAAQYFGKTIAGAAGATYNTLTPTEKQQVASAKALRASTGFNGLYSNTQAEKFDDILPTGNISLNYKFNEDHSTYVSWQRGAKAGISQISGVDKLGTPVSRLVNAESSNVYELGIKSAFLDKTLTVNADVFLDNLKNFQQTVTILDPIATAQVGSNQYTSITGNVPLVQIKGVELDATYTGIEYTSLRLAGAYNDARYASSVLLANPVEQGNQTPAFRDVNGRTLPNAPKFTFNLSADYRRPVFGNKEFHTDINYNYTSKYKSDAALSDYSVVNGYGVTDFGIGIGRKDKLFDANFLVKNLFDTEYRNNQTWNSYVPSNPRWIGVVLSSKL